MKRLLPLLALVVVLSLAVGDSFAGVARYTTVRDSTDGNFVALTGGTAIPSVTGSLDDGYSPSIPIGFAFVYDGVPYTAVNITTQGYLTLGGNAAAQTFSNAIGSTTHKPVIAPFWDDLAIPALANVTYLSSGGVFTVEWNAVTRTGPANGPYTFQVKLYSSGVIEFNYGTMTTGGTISYSCGINDPISSTNHFLSLQTVYTNNFSSTVEANSLSALPGIHVRYTFTPPVPLASVMSSDITIGPGLYPTVKAAMDTLRNYGINSNINILLPAGTTTEPGVQNDWDFIPGTHPSSGNYTVTLKLGAGVSSAVISTSSATDAIRLRGMRNLIIDGDDPTTGGTTRSLTINNTNAAAAARGIVLLEGAQSNTIKNCVLTANAVSGSASSFGVVVLSTANTSTSSTTRGAYGSVSYNTFDNNDIKDGATNRPTNCVLVSGTTTAGLEDSSNVFSNNTIRNFGGTGTSVHGVRLEAGSVNTTIRSNDIYLTAASTAATTMRAVLGNATSVVGTLVEKNLIHDLLSTASNANIHGVGISGGGSMTVQNNFIYLNPGSLAGTGTADLRGISQQGGSLNMYYNSVRLGGVQVAQAQAIASAAFRRTTTSSANVLDMRNNILYNARSRAVAGSGGRHYAIVMIDSATATLVGTTSNNNVLYADSSGGFVASIRAGASDSLDLTGWKSKTGKDGSSLAYYPSYTSATNLHIPAATVTPLESGGQTIGGLAVDYDNDVRPGPAGSVNGGATAPDIGADEFDGVPADVSAPVINYTALANTHLTANRSLVTTITDNLSGVQRSGTGEPRIRYKKGAAGSYFLSNGTEAPTGTWTFSIDHSNIGGVATNDTVFYYVAAQDSAGNAGTTPAGSSPMIDPPNATVASPAFYKINPTFSGTVTIGTSPSPQLNPVGTFPTMKAFFDSVNASTVTGDITANVIGDLNEGTSSAILNAVTYSGGPWNILIQPSGGSFVDSGANATGLIILNGADKVTFDGLGKTLRFKNTAAGPVITLQNDATLDTVRACVIEGAASGAATGSINFSTSVGPFGGATGNDNNVIAGNTIRDRSDAAGVPTNGVYSAGTAGVTNSSNIIAGNEIVNWTGMGINLTPTGNGDTWTISSNSIFQTASRTTALTGIGIISTLNGMVISNNSIGGSSAARGGSAMTTTSNFFGIVLSAGTTVTSEVQGNTIGNVYSSATGTDNKGISVTAGNVNIGTSVPNSIGGTGSDTIRCANTFDGIAYSGAGTADIRNNVVQGLIYNAADFERLSGVYVTAGTATIKNNSIHDFSHTGTTTTGTTYIPVGIYVSSSSAGQNIEGNTIYNFTQNSAAAAYVTLGMYVSSTASATVTANRIYGLMATGTGTTTASPLVYGIYHSSGSATYANNMISLGTGVGNDVRLFGIFDASSSATPNRFYYNSVNIEGAATSGSNLTFGFSRTSTTDLDTLRNNILANMRTGSTGRHFAIGNASATGWGSGSSNYNLFVTANTDTVGQWVGVGSNLTGWQSASGGDANTVASTAAAGFTSTATGNLHLDLSVSSLASNAGTPISVTTDFDGNTRSVTTPDIGADEVTYPAPAAFALSSPADGSIGQPVSGTLSWAASTGATRYDVYLDGNPVPVAVVSANQTGTTYAYSVPSGTYYWDVVAENPDGSANSNNGPFDFTTVVPPAAPSALTLTVLGPVPPAGAISIVELKRQYDELQVTGKGSKADFAALEAQINQAKADGIKLSTNAVGGIQLDFTDNAPSGPNTEDSFYVYGKLGSAPATGGNTSPDFLAALDSSAGSGSTVTYTHTPLGIDEHWYYKVTAKNGQGESAAASADTTTNAATPGAPTFSDVAWNRFKIYVDENGNPSSVSYAIHETSTNKYLTAGGTLSSATEVWQSYASWGGASGKLITGLTRGTSYTFEVKARNSINVETPFGTSASQATNYDQPLTYLTENFTSVAFPPAGWSLQDEGTLRWLRETSTQPNGISGPSARYNFFNASSSESDTLVSPALDFTGALDASLNWYHAYRSYSGEADSVSLIISSDGGSTWSSLFVDGYPNMSTLANNTGNYIPTASGDWRLNTVAIPGAYLTNNVKVGWYANSAFGNNYWLDSVFVLKKAHPDTLIVRKYNDADGNMATSGDRTLKSWYLELWKDSVGTGTMVGSGSTDSLYVTNLLDGTYIAVEADSASWYHIGKVRNGTPVTTSARYDTVVASGGGITWITDFVNSQTPPPVLVTFRVDMRPKMQDGFFLPDSDYVEVKGGFNGWAAGDTLADGDLDSIYTKTLTLSPNTSYDYKFYKSPRGAYGWEDGIGNRNVMTSTADTVLPAPFFNDDDFTVPATFSVNMKIKMIEGTFTPPAQGVFVRGNFNSWGPPVGPMTDGDNDSIYTFTTGVPSAKLLEYKFWTDAGLGWESVSNRQFNVLSNTPPTLPVWYFDDDSIANIPGFLASPLSIAFGSVEVADTLSDTVYVYNTGLATLNISSITSDNSVFTLTPNSGTLAVGESLLVMVSFIPDSAQAESGTLTFTHDAAGSPGTVTLSGTGYTVVPMYFLSLSPDSVFNEDPLKIGKSKKPVKRHKGLYPNWSNLLDEVNAQGGFGPGASESDSAGGMLLGSSFMYSASPATPLTPKWKPVKDSAAIYCWVRLAKWDFKKSIGKSFTNIQKTMIDKTIGKHTGAASGFDTTTDGKLKKLVKQQTKLTPKKQNNKLISELIALKVNIAASAMGKTPAGFGDLLFDVDGNFLDEMSVRDISNKADSMMTFWSGYTQEQFDSLHSAVYSINRAFLGPLDTLTFEATSIPFPLGKLTVAGQVDVNTLTYLKLPTPFVPTRVIALNGEVESPEDFDTEEYDEEEGVPVAAKLYQNFPNPFNPSTTIAFRLLEVSTVTIKIYDLLGQEIATLLNGEDMEEGLQSLQFSADGLSSGVYFYRIDVQGQDDMALKTIETRKMVLLK